jgi:hypothetical protein
VDEDALEVLRFLHLVDDWRDLHEVRPGSHDVENFHVKIRVASFVPGENMLLKLALGLMFAAGQLSGPGGALPQILHPSFKPSAPLKAGSRGEVTVSFNVIKGYAIDRMLPLTLKLTPQPGVTLSKTDLAASGNDPKAKDQYYVDLPTIKFPVSVAKAGAYEIPAKLKYFFCNKADGFCSFQVLDVKIPINVN